MRAIVLHICMLILMISIFSCTPRFIEHPERVTLESSTKVYNGPGTDYDLITTLDPGTQLNVFSAENDWLHVELPNGRMGWIQVGITKSIGRDKVIALRDARIRRGPGLDYKPFAIAKKGKILESLGERGNWYQIDLNDGNKGWVSKEDVNKTSYLNLTVKETSRIYSAPDTSSRHLIFADPGTELIQLQKQGRFYQVRLPGGDTGWIEQQNVEIIKEQNLQVKDQAYLRRGPNKGYDVIKTVDVGLRLTLLSQDKNWYEVRTPDGTKGWIYKDMVKTIAAADGQTISDEAPFYVVARVDCNIRQGYGIDWQKIGQVKEGTILLKIGQKDNWLRIKMPDEKIGWVRQDLVLQNPTIVITLEECNIRLGYSTNFKKLATVPMGTPLEKLAREVNNWSRIRMVDGTIGWIRNDLFAPIDSLLFANTDCNVRKGPSTDFDKIERISYGTPVYYLGKEANWFKVRLIKLNEIGYIRDDLLDLVGNQTVTNYETEGRAGPGDVYKVVKHLPRHTSIKKISEKDGWFHVKISNTDSAWIAKRDVGPAFYPVPNYQRSQLRRNMDETDFAVKSTQNQKIDSPVSSDKEYDYYNISDEDYAFSLPPAEEAITVIDGDLRTSPSPDASVVMVIEKQTKLNKISESGDWVEVVTPEGLQGWVPRSVFGIEETKYLYTNRKSNVRKGPGTNYDKIEEVKKGTRLKKIEKRDNWYNVVLPNNKTGWIYAQLVDMRDEKTIPPAVPLNVNPQPDFSSAVTMQDAKLYDGPSEHMTAVKSVGQNTHLTIIGRYSDWSHVVLYDGADGWIQNNVIQEKYHEKIIVIRNTELKKDNIRQSESVKIAKVGDVFRPYEEKGNWFRVFIKNQGHAWIIGENVKRLRHPPVYVNEPTADVRYFPATDSRGKVIGRVNEGEPLEVLDDYKRWYFIRTSMGQKGWIPMNMTNYQKQPRIIVNKGAEVYEKPTAGSILKARVADGEKLLALDKNANWYKIRIRNGEIGWIYAGLVREDLKGTELVKEEANLRLGPGDDYRIVKTVKKGEQAKLLDTDGNWRKIQLDSGEIGWIRVEETRTLSMQPVTAGTNAYAYENPNSNSRAVGKVIMNKSYKPIQKKENWYYVQLADGKFGWVNTRVFESKKRKRVFTLNAANIRNGPGTSFEVVQSVEPATDLYIIGSSGNWYKVVLQIQDKVAVEGFIRKDLVFEE